jgi:hypothetical protein
MNMSEEKMRKSVAESLSSKEAGSVPGFEETWLVAERRYMAQKRRFRTVTGIAASLALIAIVVGLSLRGEQQTLPDFELSAGLMNSTLWSAPSDVLMPEHAIDIYQDIPDMPVSTDFIEGTLL